MDASKLIDQLTLELLVKKSVNSDLFQPLFSLLKGKAADGESSRLIGELERLVSTGNGDASETSDQCLILLEAISNRLNQSQTKSAAMPAVSGNAADGAGLLAYDVTHDGEILDSFFAEVSGHLQSLEQNLIVLESDRHCADAINSVFGAMHSLKGIMGFLDVKCAHQLAHEAEAVMEIARSGNRGIDPVECDAILRTVDALREIQMLILTHTGDKSQPFFAIPKGCSALLTELSAMASKGEKSAAKTEINENRETQAQSLPTSEQKPAALENQPARHHVEATTAVRVKVEKLDALMEAIGELVVVQSQIHMDPTLSRMGNSRLAVNLSQFGKITRDLQSIALALRMHPLRDLFGRMTRLARDISHKQKKSVEIVIDGDETELDKNVIEALVDPLTHLIRNAIDHGIDFPDARIKAGKPERATLSISARHQSGNVIVTISDDGRGLDRERICARAVERGLVNAAEKLSDARIHQLIFEPGFSTADRVTELSGRGVGLDVVRRNIQSMGGFVSVDSVPGRSTTFSLTLPLTLAIIDGLIIRTGSERYIVPITSVVESVRPARGDVSTIQERGEVINVRGTILPLLRLSDFTKTEPLHSDPCEAIVMIVECGTERCALMTDELVGQQQVVIRSMGSLLKNVRGIASGAILGDGKVGLILDVAQILQASRESLFEEVCN
jgi:two-component system chemotaxis sensor kinase CheA